MGREPAGAGSTPAGHPQAHSFQRVANSSGREPGSYPGGSGFKPLATHQPATPSWRNRQTHRSQKPEPQGMSVRLGPRGPIDRSPVAQRQSSALMRRRPVDRAHPGPPTTSADPRPSTTKEVCHETDQRRQRELSRSRANAAKASRPRRESSAVTASSAARRSSSRSSAATIHAHVAPRGRFKRCCLRSGCFRRREPRSLRALSDRRSCQPRRAARVARGWLAKPRPATLSPRAFDPPALRHQTLRV